MGGGPDGGCLGSCNGGGPGGGLDGSSTETFDGGSNGDSSENSNGDSGGGSQDNPDAASTGASPRVLTTPPPTNPQCVQSSVSPQEVEPPATKSYIYPSVSATPFYQWGSNTGYCGEVSLMQAGMANGQWMSQLNARLVCGGQANGIDGPLGAPLLQSGPNQADGETYCKKYPSSGGDANTQLLLENEAPENAATCLTNARLAYKTYDYTSGQNVGVAGYQNYMSWVKAEMIAGHQVTIGVLDDDTEPVYDHIVTVLAIGTNHEPGDSSYYGDDVIFIDDHGVDTITNGPDEPAIPPGAGNTQGCTPYVFGYTFDKFGMTAAQYDAQGGGGDTGIQYAEVIPGLPNQYNVFGGDGYDPGTPETGHNFAFSVSGAADSDGVTLPVALSITGSTTNGTANPADVLAGFNYENPFIGTDPNGDGCTNTLPQPMTITMQVTVSGLTPGVHYNLYEYDSGLITGVGAAAALSVPTSHFNANASMATATTPFTPSSNTYVTSVTKSSQKTVVFRAVPASAP